MKFRFFLLSVAAIITAACTGNDPEAPSEELVGSIELSVDKSLIKCDGSDKATFSVILTDSNGKEHDVTSSSDIYSNATQAMLDGNTFVTTESGEYSFYAMYGLSISKEIKVTAIDNIVDLPADPQEGSTSFKHRMLLIQHTGTNCPNCPRMMDSLKDLAEDPTYNDLYTHVASHSYNENGIGDDAYSPAAVTLSGEFCSGFYPDLTFNLTKENTGTDLREIKAKIEELKKDKAEAGICAAVQTSGNVILVNTEIKVARDNQYRISVWVLEDDIYSRQSGASESWYNTHENALRYMHGTSVISKIYGEKAGSLKAGDKKSIEVSIPVESNWKVENCEVMIIVSSADQSGNYELVNSIVCPVGESVAYEYI